VATGFTHLSDLKKGLFIKSLASAPPPKFGSAAKKKMREFRSNFRSLAPTD
jgi:hypothetical protein